MLENLYLQLEQSMKRLTATFFVMIMGISLVFGLRTPANPGIVSYGGSYPNRLIVNSTITFN